MLGLDFTSFNAVLQDWTGGVFLKGTEISVGGLISPRWWLQYLLRAYDEDPYHVTIELFCILVILWLLFRPSYDPSSDTELTEAEEAELIREWVPEPLVPPAEEKLEDCRVVEEQVGPTVRIGERELISLVSSNFLGLAVHPEVKRVSKETICKYGVGSCGPRGFYGTIDVHLKLEDDLAKWLDSEEAIIYSDSIACTSSVIPAFAKRGDLLVCDEAVSFAIHQGVRLSRSNVLFFKHNDVEDLRRVLQDVDQRNRSRGGKLTRRFIIVEGVYHDRGDMCPLKEIVALKNEFKYRLIVDDSLGIGVYGKTGRGCVEESGLAFSDVEAVCGALDASFGSVGGFCVGSHKIIDHQRLSGAGYCFSASSPPYTATAASKAVEIVQKEPERLRKLRDNGRLVRKLLGAVQGVEMGSSADCPLVHLRLTRSRGVVSARRISCPLSAEQEEDGAFWRRVAAHCEAEGVLVDVPIHVEMDGFHVVPSLKLLVTMHHSVEQLEKAAKVVAEAIAAQD